MLTSSAANHIKEGFRPNYRDRDEIGKRCNNLALKRQTSSDYLLSYTILFKDLEKKKEKRPPVLLQVWISLLLRNHNPCLILCSCI